MAQAQPTHTFSAHSVLSSGKRNDNGADKVALHKWSTTRSNNLVTCLNVQCSLSTRSFPFFVSILGNSLHRDCIGSVATAHPSAIQTHTHMHTINVKQA